jgi:hypothetical protein
MRTVIRAVRYFFLRPRLLCTVCGHPRGNGRDCLWTCGRPACIEEDNLRRAGW